ncbi:MAG: Dabb family protein [Clostridiales bacterium]|nr:Dabb family protein [Clostridiales bacterium]
MDRYQNHPKHLEAAQFIREAAVQRACVDYEMEGQRSK